MKYLFILLTLVLSAGVSEIPGSELNENPQTYKPTTCLTKQDLDKPELKQYRSKRGVCEPRIDGRGHVCVKARWFEKKDCVGTYVLEQDSLPCGNN